MKTKTIKVECKSSKLFSILHAKLAGKMNKARIKFFALFVCALVKAQTVCFQRLANCFDSSSKSDSSHRRIQRFMALYALDIDLIAELVFSMLPHKPPYRLALDRTNWKFGQTNINILALAVVYDGISFPILFTMLDKQGNSHTDERIALVERFIRLFGKDKIESLLGDREFVGQEWLAYLNRNKIGYYLRIKENFYVLDPRTNEQIKASRKFANLQFGEHRVLKRKHIVNGQPCYLSASKVKNKEGKAELQIIISFRKPEKAKQAYKERWQIETAFKALKSSGFNIEDTHLTDLERFEKLLSLVIVAFTWAFVVGIFIHQNINKIRELKHGYRAKSFVKYGLEKMEYIFLNPLAKTEYDIFKILSCS
jgi:hypothetical protein